jgi:formamidopyrimidine-DNA glycosylase
MPELAEVEHARRVWDAGLGKVVREVLVSDARVLRGEDTAALKTRLRGKLLTGSEARGKQMLFRLGKRGTLWLGIHLGMAGRLRVEGPDHEPGRHEHLVLRQTRRSLVFFDPRHFGRIRFHEGPDEPAWWSSIAPSVLSPAFSAHALGEFLDRRARPLKAVLLMQERFPGIGNWMADEILWRARLHPARIASRLTPPERAALWKAVRGVAGDALTTMDSKWRYPDTWLFAHRWEPGGHCPRCEADLDRDEIGGRTTCWCPRCQPAPR